jgi:hypothetical protein
VSFSRGENASGEAKANMVSFLGSYRKTNPMVENYPDQLEPADDAVIWRFMKMNRFSDLIVSGELYFCRADRFPDKSEGLSPEEYLPILGLNPLDLHDRRQLDDSIGCLAQFREAFYINCWHLFREETCKMWKEYGEDGVAICSRYGLLKAALDKMADRAFIGQIRYGSKHLTGWNLFRFITTKRLKYADEREVRAFLWIIDPHAGVNRHIDVDNRVHTRPLTPPAADRVADGHRRRVDLQQLITEIVVTPWASPSTSDEVTSILKTNAYLISVKPSTLTRYRELLPCSYMVDTNIVGNLVSGELSVD